MDKADPNVAKNLIPYLKQLKINTDFGVGIIVHTWNSAIMIDPKGTYIISVSERIF